MPGIESVFWNWEEGVAYVRFASGQRPDKEAFRNAIEKGTRFKLGETRYINDAFGLPDELQ